MGAVPTLTLQTPTDGSTILTSAYLVTLQNNVTAYVSQFLPLVGGTMQGPIGWHISQTFPAAQTLLPSNPSYPHQNIWRTVWDHINDPSVHLQKGPPQLHASTHEIGGSDAILADQVGAGSDQPTVSIRSYVDTQIASAKSSFNPNFAPTSYYQIGGTALLYGDQLAINAANPSESIKTYVDTAIAGLGASNGPTPTITSLTLNQAASAIAFTAGSVNITSLGATVFKGDGTNLFIACKAAAGIINFGNQTSGTVYGNLSAAGYAIGSTVIGPNGGVLNGATTVNGDITVNRSATTSAHAGQLAFGQAADSAYLSYGVDNAAFYLSKALTVAANLTLTSGNTFAVGSVWSVSPTAAIATGIPLQITNGTGLTLLGTDTTVGNLELRATGANAQPYLDFVQGSTGNNTPNYTQRLILSGDGKSLGFTGGVTASYLSLNGGYAPQAGDVGAARSASTGALFLGTGLATAGMIDFGITAAGVLSFSVNGGVLSQIKADGTLAVGASTYGPLGTSVAGVIQSTKAIYAGSGLTFSGAAGFSFSGSSPAYNDGLFSNGPGDVRLYAGGNAALLISGNGAQATFYNNLTVTAALSSATLSTSGAATIGSNLTITGSLYAGGSTITKFRVKNVLPLGYLAGTVNTSTPYPNTVVPAYAGGTIDAIRLSALTADSGTATTFQIKLNGAVIGSVALPNGQKTAKSYPITNPQPINEGDQLQAICTQAGTATGVQVILETSQYLT